MTGGDHRAVRPHDLDEAVIVAPKVAGCVGRVAVGKRVGEVVGSPPEGGVEVGDELATLDLDDRDPGQDEHRSDRHRGKECHAGP